MLGKVCISLALILQCCQGFGQSSQSSPQAQSTASPIAATPPDQQKKLDRLQEVVNKSENPLNISRSEPFPNHVTYGFFFMHLENLNQLADRLEASGKDGHGWRTVDQNAAGLSAEEGQKLSQIAAGCRQSLKDQDTKIQTAGADFHNRHPNGEYLKLPPPPEFTQLLEDRKQIINTCIDNLRATLGDASFQKLDAHVQNNFGGVQKTKPTSAQPTPAVNVQEPKK